MKAFPINQTLCTPRSGHMVQNGTMPRNAIKMVSLTHCLLTYTMCFSLMDLTIDNSPSSPREAWMPEPVKQQPLPVQSRPIKDQLLKTSAVGKKAPLRPQNQSRYSDSSLIDRTLSVSSLSLAPSRVAQRENYEGQVGMFAVLHIKTLYCSIDACINNLCCYLHMYII